MKDKSILLNKIESNSYKIKIAKLIKDKGLSTVSAVSLLIHKEHAQPLTAKSKEADINIANSLLANKMPSIKAIERDIINANILNQDNEESRVFAFRSLINGKSIQESLVYAALQQQKKRERGDKSAYRQELLKQLEEFKLKFGLHLLSVDPSKAKTVDIILSSKCSSEEASFTDKVRSLPVEELNKALWEVHSSDINSKDRFGHGVRHVFRKMFYVYLPATLKIEVSFHDSEPTVKNVAVSIHKNTVIFSLPINATFDDIYSRKESILRTLLFVLDVEAEARGFKYRQEWKLLDQERIHRKADLVRRERHHGIEPDYLDSFTNRLIEIPVESLVLITRYADNIRKSGYALSNKLYQIKDCYLTHALKAGRGKVVGVIRRENNETLKTVEFKPAIEVATKFLNFLEDSNTRADFKKRAFEVLKSSYEKVSSQPLGQSEELNLLERDEYKQSIGQSIVDHYLGSSDESLLFSVAKDIGNVHVAKSLFTVSEKEEKTFSSVTTFEHVRRKSISTYFNLAVIELEGEVFVMPSYKVHKFITDETADNIGMISTRNKISDNDYSIDTLKDHLGKLKVSSKSINSLI